MNENQSAREIYFEAFGVAVEVNCNDEILKNKIKSILPAVLADNLAYIEKTSPEHIFRIVKRGNTYTLTKNAEPDEVYTDENLFLDFLSSQIRITIAEFAKSRVFIHSGAVGWRGSGVIIPGQSYSGKTTLVSELIKTGAEYYSDEYAVIDEKGFLHPYPKKLSMRGIIDDFTQIDKSPETFGAKIGITPIPVKYVLITNFEKESEWKPQPIKTGEGMLEILQHTIPIRHNPAFVLNVLKKIGNDAIILKSSRGDANSSAKSILEYLNNSKF